jgi:hypothetical protein
MEIAVRLTDLTAMHPRLLWHDVAASLAAVSGDSGVPSPFAFELAIDNVPGFDGGILQMAIDSSDVSEDHLNQLRKTYERSRLVELAAIAVAGLGLYHAGGHEIRDVALRGSAADYLVDDANFLLEIAGRSRKSDFESAWEQKWNRLSESGSTGFFVCVCEFETPAGRLAFRG